MRNKNQGPTRRDILRMLTLTLAGQSGCGYSLRAPYDTNVLTVCVPIFRSVSFRRDVQFQLTLLVIQEIEKRTPYKVVSNREEADTILEGTVNFADKNIMVENPFNLPRQLIATMQVSVNWVHNPPLDYERNREATVVSETVYFAPELGETTTTAFYRTS